MDTIGELFPTANYMGDIRWNEISKRFQFRSGHRLSTRFKTMIEVLLPLDDPGRIHLDYSGESDKCRPLFNVYELIRQKLGSRLLYPETMRGTHFRRYKPLNVMVLSSEMIQD